MTNDWAAQQLNTIRTLMERSALYRRALAPIMTLAGLLALVGGGIGWTLKFDSSRGFLALWLGVAMMAVAASLLLARRQALKDREPFWSPPARRVAQAMSLPLLLGAGPGFAGLVTNEWPMGVWILICYWMLMYGCALHSAGAFTPLGVRRLGWLFALSGPVLLLVVRIAGPLSSAAPHLAMGTLFGGLHLAYGLILYLTGSRKESL